MIFTQLFHTILFNNYIQINELVMHQIIHEPVQSMDLTSFISPVLIMLLFNFLL